MTHLGQNASGDFDQLSIAGVDFGHDYMQDYGIIPTNLNSEELGMDPYVQMGHDPYMQLGDSADFGTVDQLGLIPEGLGQIPSYNPYSLGELPTLNRQQLGYAQQLGQPNFLQAQFMGIPAWVLIAGAGAAWWFFIKK